ncbi:hypothetical protein ACAF76_005225 [Brevibacillus sp. TJ4]|uniref:hypothetical protein n=1 Tax=Brevibacillus sp. TJ4 TaxID=3234853 RepID=UPI0037D9645E
MMEERERLRYRRQFVIGSRYVDEAGWQRISLAPKLYLTAHPDLEVVQVQTPLRELTLLGYMIDPRNPQWGDRDILQHVADQSSSWEELIRQLEPIGGRWIVLSRDQTGFRLLHDACGMRQVFYAVCPDGVWCASQAGTLAAQIGAKRDDSAELAAFLASPEYRKAEGIWPGDESPYIGIRHLQPNHALDLGSGQVTRYWPAERLEPLEPGETVRRAIAILQGSMRAIADRADLMLPVTAGWDSRVLLAASREISDRVHYYISVHPGLPRSSPDVEIPSRLLPRVGLTLHIHDATGDMDESFVEINRYNAQMRDLPKSHILYHHFLHAQGKVNVSGNNSEIARETYCDYHPNRKLDGRFLARHIQLGAQPYAIRHYEQWLREISPAADKGIRLLTLFEWEQISGNWGAMHVSEQDIAVEEFAPFNNRQLLSTLLAVQHPYGARNRLYREMIRQMWPELLEEQVNPLSGWKRWKYIAKKMVQGGSYYGYEAWRQITGLLGSPRKEETT